MLSILEKQHLLTSSNIDWVLNNTNGYMNGESDRLYINVMKQLDLNQSHMDVLTHSLALPFLRFLPFANRADYPALLTLFKNDPIHAYEVGLAAFDRRRPAYSLPEKITPHFVSGLIHDLKIKKEGNAFSRVAKRLFGAFSERRKNIHTEENHMNPVKAVEIRM